jgi:uncharacterized protein YggT (Ycf19 family)
MASLDISVLFRLVVALATILMGFALLKWREQIVDSSWPWRWLIGLDERLRRPLEVLYVLIGMVLIMLGAGGLYVLARQP